VSLQQAFSGVLPVDVAVSSDGATQAVVAAGGGTGAAATDNLYVFQLTTAVDVEHEAKVAGQTTAVAYEPNGELLVQTREPAAIWIVPSFAAVTGALQSIPLSTVTVQDTGNDIFHTHAGALIACASCHPEGGDDGHVWVLDGNKRRTPSLRGTIAGTAPYHWPGDEADFAAIVKNVYVQRMSGAALTTDQTAVLSAWVNAIPAPPAPTWVDAAAATAGRAVFERADVACTTCHNGTKMTNNATVDVGTGGAFQVPPLVGVGWRTPLLHDGCAATIADRFGKCATTQHGNISSLSPTDVANLTAYLETL
jgi:cytochrome c553